MWFRMLLLAGLIWLVAGCNKEDLPPPHAVHVKFVNQTGKDLSEVYVNLQELGTLKKGKSTRHYVEYERLGAQFGFALVEAVTTIDGEKYYASESCRGVCGTPSAPFGEWLPVGYYRIGIRLAPPGHYLAFVMLDD